jgi:hypothetical protein
LFISCSWHDVVVALTHKLGSAWASPNRSTPPTAPMIAISAAPEISTRCVNFLIISSSLRTRALCRKPLKFVNSGFCWRLVSMRCVNVRINVSTMFPEYFLASWVPLGSLLPTAPSRRGGSRVRTAHGVAHQPRLGRAHTPTRGGNEAVNVGVAQMNRAAVPNVNDDHPAIFVRAEGHRVRQFSHRSVQACPACSDSILCPVLGTQMRPVASKTQDASAVARSSSQVGECRPLHRCNPPRHPRRRLQRKARRHRLTQKLHISTQTLRQN